MSKTHYDDFISDARSRPALNLIDETIRQVKATPQFAEAKDISYIHFKAINSELINRANYDDNFWQTLYAIFNFRRNGEKVYEIAQSLCDRFLATHIKVVPTELLKMPYQTILMRLPRGVLVRELDERSAYVSDIYIHDGMDFGDIGVGRILKLYVVCRDRSDETKWFNMNWIIFLNEPTVEDCVIKSKETILRYFREGQAEKEGIRAEMPSEQDLKFVEDTFSFVMKALLYIVGAEADIIYEDKSAVLFQKLQRVKSGGKRKEIERRLSSVGSPRYLVGSRIVLSRGEKIMYEGIKTGKWSLSYRFCVAGHFRNQAYGEGHKLRKVIFIQPFWKGSDLSEVINKDHYVK